MTDPISDLLTRLRNASKARLDECVIPHSTLKEAIAVILLVEGYVAGHSNSISAAGHKTLVVKMKYVDGAPAGRQRQLQRAGRGRDDVILNLRIEAAAKRALRVRFYSYAISVAPSVISNGRQRIG